MLFFCYFLWRFLLEFFVRVFVEFLSENCLQAENLSAAWLQVCKQNVFGIALSRQSGALFRGHLLFPESLQLLAFSRVSTSSIVLVVLYREFQPRDYLIVSSTLQSLWRVHSPESIQHSLESPTGTLHIRVSLFIGFCTLHRASALVSPESLQLLAFSKESLPLSSSSNTLHRVRAQHIQIIVSSTLQSLYIALSIPNTLQSHQHSPESLELSRESFELVLSVESIALSRQSQVWSTLQRSQYLESLEHSPESFQHFPASF